MKFPVLCLVVLLAVTSLFAQTAPNGERYVNTPFLDNFNGPSVNGITWQVAGWSEHGGQTSPSRCFVRDSMLVMQFINSSTDGYLSSAIQTRLEYFFGKWEFRARPSSVPGVLNSFYTIDWTNTTGGTSTREEIDIEFLTKSFSGTSGQVHYALHKTGATSYQTNPDVPLGFNPSSAFHVYGFNITPTKIEWLADSVVKRTYNYSSGITITAPYQLKLNFWSAVSWIGGPPTPNVVCEYLIDWIKFTPDPSLPVHDVRTADAVRGLYTRADQNTLYWYQAAAAPMQLRLFDAHGNLVRKCSDPQAAAGNHALDLANRDMRDGVYLFVLTAGQASVSGKVALVQ
jgi:beta-glucanase (GH16 family)